MRCHKAKNLAYFKESELTDRERKKIINHLAKCDSCKKYFNETEQAIKALRSLQAEPTLNNAESLTFDIMRAIGRSQEQYRKPTPLSERLVNVLIQRNTRVALGATIVLLLGFFCMQEATILRRLHHLEQRLAQQPAAATATRSSLTRFQKTMELIDLTANTDQIIIDKESLEKLLQSYGELEIENKLLFKLLEEKTLALAGINLDDGLTRDELRTLIDNKDVLDEMQNL